MLSTHSSNILPDVSLASVFILKANVTTQNLPVAENKASPPSWTSTCCPEQCPNAVLVREPESEQHYIQ